MDPISAAAGMTAASRRFEASAGRVARMDVEPGVDLAREALELIGAKAQFKASAQLVRVADEMLGALLDIKA
jgi:flagellar hook protein FlgE